MEWLSKIDPTVVAVLLTTALSFFKHTRDAGDTVSYKAAIASALKVAARRLLADPANEDLARAKLEQAAYAALARAGVKKPGASIKLLVHAAVEAAVLELHERIDKKLDKAKAENAAALEQLPVALEQLASGAAGVVASMDEAERRGRAAMTNAGPIGEELRDPSPGVLTVHEQHEDQVSRAELAAAKVRALVADKAK